MLSFFSFFFILLQIIFKLGKDPLTCVLRIWKFDIEPLISVE